jgi:hypothetical protein
MIWLPPSPGAVTTAPDGKSTIFPAGTSSSLKNKELFL